MQHIKWAKSSKIQSLCNIKRNFVNFSCTLFKKLQKLVKLEKNFVQFRKSGGKFSSTFYFVRIITVMTKYVQNRSEKEIISWHINYSLYLGKIRWNDPCLKTSSRWLCAPQAYSQMLFLVQQIGSVEYVKVYFL